MKYKLEFVILIIFSVLNSISVSQALTVYPKYKIQVFDEPSMYGYVVCEAYSKEALTVIEIRDVWYKIKNKVGDVGWISSKWIKSDGSSAKELARLTLETEIKNTPKTDIYQNLQLYKELLSLFPSNTGYKQKVEYFEAKRKDMFHFRSAKWGASRKQVIKSEKTRPIYSANDLLQYSSTIAGMQMAIKYFFSEGLLTSAEYIVTENYSDLNRYISNYKYLEELLERKYGIPSIFSYWQIKDYKNDPANHGKALSLGHFQKIAEWENLDSKISLILTGDSGEIILGMTYSSKEYALLEKKVVEQKRLKVKKEKELGKINSEVQREEMIKKDMEDL